MQSHQIRFQTQTNFYISGETFGDTSCPPVFLLHGGGQTHHSWGDTARFLAEQGYYCFSYDARGHGQSDWASNGDYTGDALVGDLKYIISQFEQPPVLVGASMGGITSLLLAGENPAIKVAGLVLVDIAPKSEQKGIERIFAFMSANMKDGFASVEEAAQAVANYLPGRAKPTDNERLKKNLRFKDGRWYWHWDPALLELWERQRQQPDYAINAETRLYAAARSLTVPTLIVRGGISDVVSERVMVEFLDAVPHVKSVTVGEAGHMVAGDSNHSFSKAVLHFLQEIYPNHAEK